MKTAIYLRVSTTGQTHDPQRQELLAFCERNGWTDVEEFTDVVSGARFTRAGLERLMKAVRAGKIKRVVAVKLDRIGRSLPHLAMLISEFDRHGVAIVCTSQGIDTSRDNPAGRLQMHVLMAVAEFERTLISERTKAGLAAARSRGKHPGRRGIKLTEQQMATVREYVDLRAAAVSLGHKPRPITALAKELGVSLGKAWKLLNEAENKQAK